MASSPPTGLKALNAKHYIVAALTATVAAAVIVTVFFVVLSPARIYFSVTKASRMSSYHLLEGVDLSLTLAANNTSQRAAVMYQSLSVDVVNYKGSELLYSTRANMNTTDMSQWHPHGSVATVDATVSLLRDQWKDFFAGDDMASAAAAFVVQVTAAARFKVAGIPTRLYDITVRCGPITFPPNQSLPIGCSPV